MGRTYAAKLSSLCELSRIFGLIGVLVETRYAKCANLIVVLSVLRSKLFQWCKLWLVCLRNVLAVTILLIVIFVLVVIAMSGVIVLPKVSTYVMCRQFYHYSTKTTEIVWSYVRKHISIPCKGCKANRINLTTYLTAQNYPKLSWVLTESSYVRHRGVSYRNVLSSVVEQLQ